MRGENPTCNVAATRSAALFTSNFSASRKRRRQSSVHHYTAINKKWQQFFDWQQSLLGLWGERMKRTSRRKACSLGLLFSSNGFVWYQTCFIRESLSATVGVKKLVIGADIEENMEFVWNFGTWIWWSRKSGPKIDESIINNEYRAWRPIWPATCEDACFPSVRPLTFCSPARKMWRARQNAECWALSTTHFGKGVLRKHFWFELETSTNQGGMDGAIQAIPGGTRAKLPRSSHWRWVSLIHFFSLTRFSVRWGCEAVRVVPWGGLSIVLKEIFF